MVELIIKSFNIKRIPFVLLIFLVVGEISIQKRDYNCKYDIVSLEFAVIYPSYVCGTG